MAARPPRHHRETPQTSPPHSRPAMATHLRPGRRATGEHHASSPENAAAARGFPPAPSRAARRNLPSYAPAAPHPATRYPARPARTAPHPPPTPPRQPPPPHRTPTNPHPARNPASTTTAGADARSPPPLRSPAAPPPAASSDAAPSPDVIRSKPYPPILKCIHPQCPLWIFWVGGRGCPRTRPMPEVFVFVKIPKAKLIALDKPTRLFLSFRFLMASWQTAQRLIEPAARRQEREAVKARREIERHGSGRTIPMDLAGAFLVNLLLAQISTGALLSLFIPVRRLVPARLLGLRLHSPSRSCSCAHMRLGTTTRHCCSARG